MLRPRAPSRRWPNSKTANKTRVTDPKPKTRAPAHDVDSTKSPEVVHQDPPSQWGSLAPLPQEALDMIYEQVFAAGDVAMTRVSKAYHENTKSALYRRGLYRVHIEPRQDLALQGNTLQWPMDVDQHFPPADLANVQNLRISEKSSALGSLPCQLWGQQCRYYVPPERLNRITAQLMRSLPNCKKLHLEFNDAPTDAYFRQYHLPRFNDESTDAYVDLDVKIGELEFLKRLDTLTLTCIDWRSGAKKTFELDLRYNFDDLERIETVGGFLELCNELYEEKDQRFKSR